MRGSVRKGGVKVRVMVGKGRKGWREGGREEWRDGGRESKKVDVSERARESN